MFGIWTTLELELVAGLVALFLEPSFCTSGCLLGYATWQRGSLMIVANLYIIRYPYESNDSCRRPRWLIDNR